MKRLSPYLRLPVCLMFFLLPLWVLGQPAPPASTVLALPDVEILPQSRLYLKGSSNVNKFTCDCVQDFQPLNAEYSLTSQGGIARFRETRLDLRTSALDCGNKGMNRDLQATLKAKKYPYIQIELHRVKLQSREQALGPDWTEMTAHAEITLAGNSQLVTMPVQARRLEDGVFQFKSFHELTLTSFGIKPPTVLLGLIKVNDEITIYIDLHVRANGVNL